jgi:TPR repeat protein
LLREASYQDQPYSVVVLDNNLSISRNVREAPDALLLRYNIGANFAKLTAPDGRGVPQDDKEAVKLFRLAAEHFQLAAQEGNAYAQINLGSMYANGRGVPQDDKEAIKWYRLAAAQGEAVAQTRLGAMYETGRGVPEDSSHC